MKNHYGYNSYARHLARTGETQLHVVPLDLGLGCPNRTSDGVGGCSFCPEHGARAVQISQSATLERQVVDAIDFAKRRYGAKKFMAYVQAFTGTFASTEKQRELYERIIDIFPFSALSVGTRPDCISKEVMAFLCETSKRVKVRVELGVQTMHDKTLERINRGHTAACSVRAIHDVSAAGLPVVAHVIIGLPGEDQNDFNETAEQLAKLPLAGMKIHNLHVIENTALAKEFFTEPFDLMNEFEYLDALIEFLRRLPRDLPILRVVTDTPDAQLIAPDWSMSKGQFVDTLERHMTFRLYAQGDLCDHEPTPRNEAKKIVTDDGSVTFWSSLFKEHYHTTVGAESEAIHKYVEPSGLRRRLDNGPVRLLDVCFGLGYNTFAAIDVVEDGDELHVTALEIDRAVVRDSADCAKNATRKETLAELFENAEATGTGWNVKMVWGDARHTILKVAEEGTFDLVYLDAFSTQRNSELWTVEFFEKLYHSMADDAALYTYCAALPVRAGLARAGFYVGNVPPYGRNRPGTIATKRIDLIKSPLTKRELDDIRNTTKGIPFEDPSGTDTNRTILKRREKLVREFKLRDLAAR